MYGSDGASPSREDHRGIGTTAALLTVAATSDRQTPRQRLAIGQGQGHGHGKGTTVIRGGYPCRRAGGPLAVEMFGGR